MELSLDNKPIFMPALAVEELRTLLEEQIRAKSTDVKKLQLLPRACLPKACIFTSSTICGEGAEDGVHSLSAMSIMRLNRSQTV